MKPLCSKTDSDNDKNNNNNKSYNVFVSLCFMCFPYKQIKFFKKNCNSTVKEVELKSK